MSEPHKKVDFDAYADNYESLLKNLLSFFNSDRGYFTRVKVDIAKEFPARAPKAILDFGCGIGLTLPFLVEAFPEAQVFGSDLSTRSLDYVRENIPGVTALDDGDIDDKRFDLIFVSCVYHHIHPTLRSDVSKRLSGLLNPGGLVCIFEHNPYNPLTQRMVSTCEFDEDAILLRPRESVNLMEKDAKLKLVSKGYYLFFPKALTFLRPIERFLRFFPLGGQYFVIAAKS